MKKCPWCRQVPVFSNNTPNKVGCKTEYCPLRGLLMPLKIWNNRGNLQKKIRKTKWQTQFGSSLLKEVNLKVLE